jgi:phenylacetate-coenzyme A ligase PaaK-like adenylate-forming protein
MRAFDEAVTDQAITFRDIKAWIADSANTGKLFLGRYLVFCTSGVTGEPGIFLHDEDEIRLFTHLGRDYVNWRNPIKLWHFLKKGMRCACLITTEGHNASLAMMIRCYSHRTLEGEVKFFPVQDPLLQLDKLVQTLNDFQPGMLAGHPTMLEMLAYEQRGGRLHIAPVFIKAGSECLTPHTREFLRSTFQATVREAYGAAEFMALARECRAGRLHANTDWAILEPVDEQNRPVLLGEPSAGILLTNLIGFVQPLIRYRLDDRVIFHTDACPCGNTLPTLTVEGRTNEVLWLDDGKGASVPFPPASLRAVAKEVPGVRTYQIAQKSPLQLLVRYTVEQGADYASVGITLAEHLTTYVRQQGALAARVTLDAEPPRRDRRSGKLRQVLREMDSW